VTNINDPYELNRFVDAQNPVYAEVCGELRRGEKRSHWMWFIFPQLRGLGSSPMAVRFGISSRREAEEYLGHIILGPRICECTQIVTLLQGHLIQKIFPYPDNLKFQSSMTLFAAVATEDSIFRIALQMYFASQVDQKTIKLL
jgi:uncharacterized protein (DUF1810 family)